jgi:hypothetical protein
MANRRTGYVMVARDGAIHARVSWTENGKRRFRQRRAVSTEHARQLCQQLIADLPPEPERTCGGFGEREPRPGFVYFIQMSDGAANPVKIGVAQDVQRRLESLLTASPYDLKVLGTVQSDRPHMLETMIHGHCQHLHITREWFRPTPELLAYVTDPSVENLRRIRDAG